MSANVIEATTASAADHIISKNNAFIAHVRDLATAYQEISTKNVEKLTASISALSAIKQPAEFIQLQQKLMTEAMNSAIADSAHIVRLTAEAFTTAFKPL
jgi:L-arabinose isomerase